MARWAFCPVQSIAETVLQTCTSATVFRKIVSSLTSFILIAKKDTSPTAIAPQYKKQLRSLSCCPRSTSPQQLQRTMIAKQNQRTAILFLAFCILSLQKADAFGIGHSSASSRLTRRPTTSIMRPIYRQATERKVFSEALLTVESFYISSPYVAAALTCGVKASAADFIAQKRQIRKRGEVAGEMAMPFHSARNVAFLFYGALYQGMAQEFIYNDLYPIWFGTSSALLTVLKKMLFDVFVQTPLFTLPVAYFFKAIVFQHSPKEAIRRYVEDVMTRGLLQKYVLLWAPVQCLTFSVVPPHLRIAFIAFVSFFWLIIFSSVSGKHQEVEVKQSDTCDLIDGTTCNIDG